MYLEYIYNVIYIINIHLKASEIHPVLTVKNAYFLIKNPPIAFTQTQKNKN